MHYLPLADPKLATFDLLDQPVWITDIALGRIVWANRAAVALWRSETLDELVNRDLNLSPTMQATLKQLHERVSSGERVHQDRTIYPKGHATRIEMIIGCYPMPDDRRALLVEGRPIRDTAAPEVLRASEAVRYAPLVVTTHALDGSTLQANTLARQVLGHHFTFQTIFADASEGERALERLTRGEPYSKDVKIRTITGPRFYALEARRVPDPVTGQDAILTSAHDMTARLEAERAKEDLVSVVSHELRTPLTAMRGAIELLAGGVAAGQPEMEAELLQIASLNMRRLGMLVDDLLDVRSLAAGGMRIEVAEGDLAPVIVAAVNTVSQSAREFAIVVESFVPAPLLIVADVERLHQVLLNLLSNAVKHSPRGGLVTVRAERQGDRVRVEVRDRGKGVPEAFRKRIFSKFAQADVSSTRSSSGTGLGLYISKTIVELHGGQLAYENAEDGGAMFFFEIPCNCVARS